MTATLTPPPQRTHEQRCAAIALANHVRTTNAVKLKAIKAMPKADGLREVARILREDMAGPHGSMPLRRLLLAPRNMHGKRAQDLLWKAEIYKRGGLVKEPPARSLSIPQCFRLADLLDADAASIDRCGRSR